MKLIRKFCLGVVLSYCVAGMPHFAAAADATPATVYTFGTLKSLPLEIAKQKSAEWLQKTGKFDPQAFDAIWANDDRSILDRTLDVFTFANPSIRTLMTEARMADRLAPSQAASMILDREGDSYFRANLATAYARTLSGKRVYEEALAALKAVTPEDVVEPSTYYFYRAVAEHALIQKDAANASIVRLLDDVADAPDRYKMVATLMYFEMEKWSNEPKDLANITRLMDNSSRRLELARGGPTTQAIQKKIVFRLDEVIKDLENQQKGNCNGGQCPGGGPPKAGGNNITPSGPAGDSVIMGGSGEGKVDEKKLKKLAEEWGKLPASERAKAIQEITRDLPPKYRPMIEEYFKSMNRMNGVQP